MREAYTKHELLQVFEDKGIETFLFERPKISHSLAEYISIDVVSDTSFYTDNRSHQSYLLFQFSFNTRKPQDKLKYYNWLKNTFNCSLTTTFDYDNEWHQAIYETQLIWKDNE